MRRAFSGEHTSSELETVLPGHELYTLIRQVVPGARVQLHLQWNTEIPVPDDSEALLHGMFDVYAERQPGEFVTTDEVLTRASKYQHAERVRS